MKPIRLAVLTMASALVMSLAPEPVFGKELVDPTTLNPPPPPRPGVCERVGTLIICEVQFSDPPFAGGSGVICGSGADTFEPFQFTNRFVTGKRYYDETEISSGGTSARCSKARLRIQSLTRRSLSPGATLTSTIPRPRRSCHRHRGDYRFGQNLPGPRERNACDRYGSASPWENEDGCCGIGQHPVFRLLRFGTNLGAAAVM